MGAARATSDCHRVAQSHLPPSGLGSDLRAFGGFQLDVPGQKPPDFV